MTTHTRASRTPVVTVPLWAASRRGRQSAVGTRRTAARCSNEMETCDIKGKRCNWRELHSAAAHDDRDCTGRDRKPVTGWGGERLATSRDDWDDSAQLQNRHAVVLASRPVSSGQSQDGVGWLNSRTLSAAAGESGATLNQGLRAGQVSRETPDPRPRTVWVRDGSGSPGNKQPPTASR